ncbi:MAG: hypothetical protein HKN09_02110 [Saprospiraceae bacterium]|nr:hypothetical protein [Saprospiraceae bacterium]
MKILKLLCIGLFVVLTSCGDDNETITTEDQMSQFEGTWKGIFDCSGPLGENEEQFEITLTNTQDNEFIFIAEDDLSATVYYVEDRIVFDNVLFNEGQGYDEMRLDGYISIRDTDQLTFIFEHEVDDDGISNCEVYLDRIN